jgi:hypothetical protein
MDTLTQREKILESLVFLSPNAPEFVLDEFRLLLCTGVIKLKGLEPVNLTKPTYRDRIMAIANHAKHPILSGGSPISSNRLLRESVRYVHGKGEKSISFLEQRKLLKSLRYHLFGHHKNKSLIELFKRLIIGTFIIFGKSFPMMPGYCTYHGAGYFQVARCLPNWALREYVHALPYCQSSLKHSVLRAFCTYAVGKT